MGGFGIDRYIRRDGPYITQLLERNYFTNAARSRLIINLKQELSDYVNTVMYPEEYTLSENIANSSTSRQWAKKSSTTEKMKRTTSKNSIRISL